MPQEYRTVLQEELTPFIHQSVDEVSRGLLPCFQRHCQAADLGKQMADKLVSELQELLRDVSVKIVHDVGVVEVRSFLGTRGAIVKTLLQQYKEEHQADPEMVFCMGDSMVDEPMFG